MTRWVHVLAACAAVLATAVTAQPEIPLNSERIEARFGSYGLELLEHDRELRVSNLFSLHESGPITRTFAVVVYPGAVDRALRSAHREILAGGSIGAVLAADGWRINKHNRFIGSVPATPRLRALMHSPTATTLATHVYELEAQRDGQRIVYALITEIHHPDYLTEREVAAIYGPVPPLSTAERRALERALERARRAAAAE